MPVVICQEWEETEHEPGWGTSVRSDGYSLHLTDEDRKAFIKSYLHPNKGPMPSYYMKPAGNFYYVKLRSSSKLYKDLVASKHGKAFSGKAPEGFLKVNAR